MLASTDDVITDSCQINKEDHVSIYFCLMMKNEREDIEGCMDNLSRMSDGGVISDNGSTDGCIKKADTYLSASGKPYKIESHPWNNYSWNRNKALEMMDDFVGERTKEKLNLDVYQPLTWDEIKLIDTYRTYAILTDIDNRFRWNDETMEKIKKAQSERESHIKKSQSGDQEKTDGDDDDTDAPLYVDEEEYVRLDRSRLRKDGYWVESRRGPTIYKTNNLIRIDPIRVNKWRYYFSIHEYVDKRNEERTLNMGNTKDIYNFYGCSGARGKDHARCYRELVYLEQDKDLYPDSMNRIIFYTAQTLFESGHFHAAKDKYLERYTKGDWNLSERYFSAIRAAECVDRSKPGGDQEYLEMIMKAYELKCDRLEAAFYVVKYYKDKNLFRVGYNLGMPFIDTVVSKNELFLDENINMYRFYDELALCAYYCGRKDISIQLARRILNYPFLPDWYRKHIEGNIATTEAVMRAEGQDPNKVAAVTSSVIQPTAPAHSDAIKDILKKMAASGKINIAKA